MSEKKLCNCREPLPKGGYSSPGQYLVYDKDNVKKLICCGCEKEVEER